MPKQEERMIAAAIYVISFFTAIIGPLVIWLLKKNDSSYIDFHGKEYINFFISYSVYSIISAILMVILIGFVMLWVIGIMAFIFTIIAALKAYEGKEYRVPFVFRLIR